jgi:hypothetical protein
MPLMPAPPMPTKWMCLMACFMRVGFSASISSATRAAACGLGQRAGLARHRQQRVAVRPAAAAARRSRRQLGLRQVQRGAVRGHPLRVVALVRGGADDQRHQDAGTPAAHSSLTVMAPARQTIRSQRPGAAAMSSMKGSTSASHAGAA